MEPRLTIRQTPTSGNGVFANSPIPKDTLILTTKPPAFHVINKIYRKEACAFCFRYDLGRNWKVKIGECGAWSCGDVCKSAWEEEVGLTGLQFWENVERLKNGRSEGKEKNENGEDDVDLMPDDDQLAWEEAEILAQSIRASRIGSSSAKITAKLTRHIPLNIDTLSPLVSGLLYLHDCETSKDSTASAKGDLSILYEAPIPYAVKSQLRAHVDSYHLLLAIAPPQLLHLVTARNIRFLTGVAYVNAFGIRSIDHTPTVTNTPSSSIPPSATPTAPMHEDPGSEVLGWAVYPEASLFNHSCAPNVKKARDGRVWRFWTSKDVEVGEEICISYLGGEERAMTVEERRQRLRWGWEFECCCSRCVDEATASDSR